MRYPDIEQQINEYIKLFPSYDKILNFFKEITIEQNKSIEDTRIVPPDIKKSLRDIHLKEGFPLIDKQDFFIDIHSSIDLFDSLCNISRNANEKLKINIQYIEDALSINALNLAEIMRNFHNEPYIEKIAGEFDIDLIVLKFLIYESIKPSIILNVEIISKENDMKNWHKGYCPICGSMPDISKLDKNGKRFFKCSFCNFIWQSDRLKCPFCENTDYKKLHYFYAEDREAYRVDLCDNCKQYIKTVDLRKINYDSFLPVDDIVTIHLDIIAQEKGYKRPVTSLWGL